MDIILLAIFSYALYRMTTGYNITPWKWIMRYVVSFFATIIGLILILLGIYGEAMMKDMAALQKITISLEPFILLYQFVLFFFFRTRIVRYVHALDQIEKNDNNNHHTPGPPPAAKDPKEQKDFSYFR